MQSDVGCPREDREALDLASVAQAETSLVKCRTGANCPQSSSRSSTTYEIMESRMSWNNHLAGLAKALGHPALLRILRLLRRGADLGGTCQPRPEARRKTPSKGTAAERVFEIVPYLRMLRCSRSRR
jgi:hypothetical protein